MDKDPNTQSYVDARGELIIQRPAPGVLLYIEKGYLEGSRGELIVAGMDRELKFAPKLTIFVDGEHLEGYDPPVRTMPTDWLKKNTARVDSQHMLVRSQIAKMGLSVAGLVLGAVIKGYTERRPFEQALQAVVARAPLRSAGSSLKI
ncbi:MAG: hypothetical protein RMJ98_03970 [Myxococcales bacterium]|nr:hypothetical protein [Polyangiaceae bacterium]MDW8248446.1 hypothetical protein [Myxococcales bacterium]